MFPRRIRIGQSRTTLLQDSGRDPHDGGVEACVPERQSLFADHPGATMKRCFLFFAVVLLGTIWSGTARAQGFSGFGNTQDVNSEIDAERSKIRQQIAKNAKPQPRPARGTAVRGGTGAADRYGRVDLAGHPVGGYPIIRGDLNGPNGGARVSRGGANGSGRRRGSRR
jgi:hypothetical protein